MAAVVAFIIKYAIVKNHKVLDSRHKLTTRNSQIKMNYRVRTCHPTSPTSRRSTTGRAAPARLRRRRLAAATVTDERIGTSPTQRRCWTTGGLWAGRFWIESGMGIGHWAANLFLHLGLQQTTREAGRRPCSVSVFKRRLVFLCRRSNGMAAPAPSRLLPQTHSPRPVRTASTGAAPDPSDRSD